MKPEIIIEVRFNTTAEGGRQTPVIAGVVDFYAVAFAVDTEEFDCRVVLGGRRLEPGCLYELPVKFLNWPLVAPKLAVGKEFELREGRRVVALGKIKHFQPQ